MRRILLPTVIVAATDELMLPADISCATRLAYRHEHTHTHTLAHTRTHRDSRREANVMFAVHLREPHAACVSCFGRIEICMGY